MKEFETLDFEKAEKKFNEDLKEIKDKLNAEKLSDEFKEKLQAKLAEEYYKSPDKDNGKIIKFPVITRKLAGICACFVLLFSSCFAFADEIENVILNILGNTDKIVENAIANGKYREIDMEYVENNGVSIKVDYVVVEDDKLYIAFNVLGEEEFDKILFNDIKIKNQDNVIIYSKKAIEDNSRLVFEDESIDLKNSVIIYGLTKIKANINDLNKLKIEINNIDYIKDDIYTNKFGNWNFEINI